jgi:hypothetical protein
MRYLCEFNDSVSVIGIFLCIKWCSVFHKDSIGNPTVLKKEFPQFDYLNKTAVKDQGDMLTVESLGLKSGLSMRYYMPEFKAIFLNG